MEEDPCSTQVGASSLRLSPSWRSRALRPPRVRAAPPRRSSPCSSRASRARCCHRRSSSGATTRPAGGTRSSRASLLRRTCRTSRKATKRVHDRVRRGLGGERVLGADPQGDVLARQADGRQAHLLRQRVQDRQGDHLRRARSPRSTPTSRSSRTGRAPSRPRCHEDLEQGEDPDGHARRLAPERDLRRRRQLHLRHDRRQGGRRTTPRRQWGCKDVWVFLGEHQEEGAAADLRLSGFADGVQEVCGSSPSGQHRPRDHGRRHDRPGDHQDDRLADGAPAGQAHARDDDRRRARDRQAQGARREPSRRRAPSARAATRSASRRSRAATSSKNHYLGCTAFFPEKYASYAMSVALDVLAGKPCRRRSTSQHKFLTHANIGQYYK